MCESVESSGEAQYRDQRTVARLQELAAQCTTARITYRKTGEDWATVREVEPYRLTYCGHNLIVLTWQLDPVLDGDAWRNFRVDRIVKVLNGGRRFRPRIEVTLHCGDIQPFVFDNKPTGPVAESEPSVAETYFRYIENTMLDGVMTNAEISEASALAIQLSARELRAIHAQVFANLLSEVAMDGEVDSAEEEQLRNMRFFLQELGWSP